MEITLKIERKYVKNSNISSNVGSNLSFQLWNSSSFKINFYVVKVYSGNRKQYELACYKSFQVKLVKSELAPVRIKFINLTLITGIMPDKMKMAKGSLTFKEDKNDQMKLISIVSPLENNNWKNNALQIIWIIWKTKIVVL